MAHPDVSSKRPYFLRAMHEWMTDNGLTPHVVIDADFPNADLPQEHLKDGRMVLNVSYQATRDLHLGNELVEFEARFSGRPRRLSIPIANVLGISAREMGEWMLFAEEDAEARDGDDTPPPDSGGRPQLRAVK